MLSIQAYGVALPMLTAMTCGRAALLGRVMRHLEGAGWCGAAHSARRLQDAERGTGLRLLWQHAGREASHRVAGCTDQLSVGHWPACVGQENSPLDRLDKGFHRRGMVPPDLTITQEWLGQRYAVPHPQHHQSATLPCDCTLLHMEGRAAASGPCTGCRTLALHRQVGAGGG